MSFTMDFVILKSNGREQLQMNSLLLHFHGGVYAVLNFVREQLVWHNRWHDRWSSNSQPFCVLSFLSGSLHTPGTGSSGSYRKARYTVHQVLTWHAQVSSLHSERLQPLPSEHARVFFRASTDKPDAGAKQHQIMQRSSLCWGLRGRHWRFKYFHVLRRREVRCRKWSNIDFAYEKLRTQMTSELHKVMRSTIDFTVAIERDQLCIQASSPTNTQTCDPQEAYNEHAHLSCRGPKSARWGLALLTFLSTFTRCAGVHHVDNVITLPEPRVATLTTGVAEASKFQGPPISRGAKSSGMQGQFGSGVGLGRIRKRAYRRACARATRNGGTYYRGRWMSDPHQGFAHDDQPAPTSSKQPTQQKHHGRHMRVMTYNAGGLGGGLYEELIHYARKVKIDILCVQESQWRFSSTWQVPGFRVVHSGHASTVKAGVMILIADALASQEQIRFEEIVEGRLLHARVQVGCQNIDILNLYQHALSKDADVYSKRLDLWRALAQCMHQIPERNQLIVMGDFNTTPTPQAGICGPGVWLKESKAKDVDELDTLLRVHRLCVLNSWSTSRPQITFEFGSIKSQLDLVITRRGNVTAISREATSLRDTQLAAWREGAKHFPVFAMIKVSWQPWWRQTQQKCGPQPNVLAMACAFSQSTPSEALTKFRNQVQASIPDKCTIDDINPVLLKAACDHFPKNKEARTHRIEDQTLVEGVSVMWKLFRQMRKQDRSIRGMWNAWKAWARFHRAYKAHKKRCQALKKAWRMDALQRVEEAAHRGDSYAVHKIVRQLAPKVARVSMQLRRDGQMLNPKQELEWLCEFFTDRFRSQEAPTSDQHTLSQPFSVSLESVERAISLIPLRKSVPRGVAPGVAWRAVADIVTPIIQREIEQLWRGGTIRVPQGWADACLFLLHKPGTTGKEPKHWRPIGLQDPVGKAIIDLVASRAKPWIVHWLKQVPQFAYLPNRSTGMALRRVFNHCNRIHAKCRALNPSIHDRKHGARPQACFGGLQVCLDLSAAFDLVPRSRIKQALDAAHVPGDVTAVLLQWLEQACYHLEHAGESRNIHPNRGVRQGCKASPILWAAFTGLVALQMDIDIRQSFAKDHLTLFADDHHLAFEFNTEQELYQAIDDVNKVISILSEMGMLINPTKAKAILRIQGTKRCDLRKKITRKVQNELRLVLGSGPQNYIPIVDKVEYLGAVIAYDNAAGLTLKHRTAKARHRFWAMAGILNSRRAMSRKSRLKLWRSCIWSSQSYAMNCLQLDGVLAKSLKSAVMRQLRSITCMPVHKTRISDDTLLDMFGLQSPIAMLLQTTTRELENMQVVSSYMVRIHTCCRTLLR